MTGTNQMAGTLTFCDHMKDRGDVVLINVVSVWSVLASQPLASEFVLII